jgi:hypothetical protein
LDAILKERYYKRLSSILGHFAIIPRACKISQQQAQLEDVINNMGNVTFLNHYYAVIHRIPGYDKLYLDNDEQGNGLCVTCRYRNDDIR